MQPKDWFTLAIAFAGLVLGVINLWRAHRSQKENLRVHVWDGMNEGRLEIEVANLAGFHLTITDVGTIKRSGERESVIFFSPPPTQGLPARVESHGNLTWELDLKRTVRRAAGDLVGAYARTASGTIFTGFDPKAANFAERWRLKRQLRRTR